jgi:hypothetical protein
MMGYSLQVHISILSIWSSIESITDREREGESSLAKPPSKFLELVTEPVPDENIK